MPKSLNKKPIPQKAAKRSLYDEILQEAEKLTFATAAETEGLDDEIALLRVKIKDILETKPDDMRLVLAIANTLARLVKTRYSITQAEKKGLGEAIKNVIKEVGIPLGVSVVSKKL